MPLYDHTRTPCHAGAFCGTIGSMAFVCGVLVCGLGFLPSCASPSRSPEISGGADDIKISRVFGSEHRGGAYKHPAAITELNNGDLYLAFYGGSVTTDIDGDISWR